MGFWIMYDFFFLINFLLVLNCGLINVIILLFFFKILWRGGKIKCNEIKEILIVVIFGIFLVKFLGLL